MPRVYKRKQGNRAYRDYTAEKLEECLNAVRKKELTQRAAAQKYGISRSTIENKLHGLHGGTIGRQRVFSDEEEQCFAQHLMTMADYNFPVNEMDFRMFVKYYLQKQGRVEPRFTNNLPGSDFVQGYLKRHPDLSQRLSSNVKRARMEVDERILSDYIDHLETSLDGIPPSRIYNYDETNLQDDPGRKRVICRRKAKYVERFCNHSKSATSVMFCGNGDGSHFLPPYVVYRSECLWDTWKVGGPPNTRYNRTKSGWFDGQAFEDWFEFHFLPSVRHHDGRIALIGDNLASHLTTRVLELCDVHNITFICLPPNATHLCQPLDVAVYRPLKIYWRRILGEWKDSDEGKKTTILPKTTFPVLLKRMFDLVCTTVKVNLRSGFRKCGIYPLNKHELLNRLTNKRSKVDVNYVGERFLEVLESKRGKSTNVQNTRRKKINVPPGKGITVGDLLGEDNDLDEQAVDSPDACVPVRRPRGRPRKKREETASSRDEETASSRAEETAISHEEESASSSSSEDESASSSSSEDDSSCVSDADEPGTSATAAASPFSKFCVGDFVVVFYTGDGSHYPGKIVHIGPVGATVSAMERSGNAWKWPKKPDELRYEFRHIVRKINPPQAQSKRNALYTVSELNDFV